MHSLTYSFSYSFPELIHPLVHSQLLTKILLCSWCLPGLQPRVRWTEVPLTGCSHAAGPVWDLSIERGSLVVSAAHKGKRRGELRRASGPLFSGGLASHDRNETPTFKQRMKVSGSQVYPRESVLVKHKGPVVSSGL